MKQVLRHALIAHLDEAVADSRLVTLSAPAGGGVSAILDQWTHTIAHPTNVAVCPDYSPQRPLVAFADVLDQASLDAIATGDIATAAHHVEQRADHGNLVFVVDDADHIDEASARLAAELLERSCRVVLGHHHAPSTNPSLDLLIERSQEHRSIEIPPLTEADIEAALGDGAAPDDVLAATGGNPLAVSLYRRPDFTSISTAVLDRFDRLPADGQGLAAVLAASPEPLPNEALVSMGRPWASHGHALEKVDLAQSHDDHVSLRHDKIRRVLYEEMTPIRRRFVHADILRHLTDRDDLTQVMHHAVGAGDIETIISVGPEAAERAARVGSHREAAKHLESVLAYEHSIPEADRASIRDALERHLAEAVG